MTQTITRSTPKPTTCPRCKSAHFSHQLSCKRCGQYLAEGDAVTQISSHSLAIAGGILAVAMVLIGACAVLHVF